MGFRNPITSATAVDTRNAPTVAGVRVYQSRDGRGQPVGVAEWSDGVPGDTPSKITAQSFGSLGGGAMTLGGGTFGGIAAPLLTMQVDQAGQSYADLTAPAGLTLNGRQLPGPQAQRSWRFERSAHTGNASDAFTSAAGVVGLVDRTIVGAPAGEYLITGTLVLFATANGAGFFTMQAGAGAGAATVIGGDSRADCTTQALPYTFVGSLNWPGGDLRTFVAYRFATAGPTVTVVTTGSAATVAYLGPRTP